MTTVEGPTVHVESRSRRDQMSEPDTRSPSSHLYLKLCPFDPFFYYGRHSTFIEPHSYTDVNIHTRAKYTLLHFPLTLYSPFLLSPDRKRKSSTRVNLSTVTSLRLTRQGGWRKWDKRKGRKGPRGTPDRCVQGSLVYGIRPSLYLRFPPVDTTKSYAHQTHFSQ